MDNRNFCWPALVATLVGCGPAIAVNDSTATGSPQTTSGGPGTTSSASSSTATAVTSASTAPVTTSPEDTTSDTTSSTTTQDDESSSSTSSISAGFITPPDGGFPDIDCDVWDNFCARGDECKPWANDGGRTWNATRCVQLPEEPDLIGESCVTEGSVVSGLDTCEARSMCFGVDAETLEGTCVAYCTGDPGEPSCADPDTTCAVGNDGVIAACLPSCDPLAQNCANAEMCVGNFGEETGFFCIPATTPYINLVNAPPGACDIGFVAVLPELIGSCFDGEPCCTAFCDITELDSCAKGLECVPWFSEGSCPGACDEGVCLSPA